MADTKEDRIDFNKSIESVAEIVFDADDDVRGSIMRRWAVSYNWMKTKG